MCLSQGTCQALAIFEKKEKEKERLEKEKAEREEREGPTSTGNHNHNRHKWTSLLVSDSVFLKESTNVTTNIETAMMSNQKDILRNNEIFQSKKYQILLPGEGDESDPICLSSSPVPQEVRILLQDEASFCLQELQKSICLVISLILFTIYFFQQRFLRHRLLIGDQRILTEVRRSNRHNQLPDQTPTRKSRLCVIYPQPSSTNHET